MGGNTFLATFLFGVIRAPPLPTTPPLANGLYREDGGDWGPSSGGGGGGGGGAAFGGDCFGDSYNVLINHYNNAKVKVYCV